MATVAQRLADAVERLEPVTETPRLDAELLMAHALGRSRAQVLAGVHEEAPAEPFETLLKRRLEGEPLAYIFGTWEFFSLEFETEAPILVPRPETEHLVEVVLEEVEDRPADILDLCTGSGCVAIAIATHAPAAHVVAVDLNPAALELAQRNARRHEVDRRVAFRQGDLFDALHAGDGSFDVVCANPPYVAEADWEQLSPTIRVYEDRSALVAGEDGLAYIRRIVSRARAYLRNEGLLAFEFGFGQRDAVEAVLREHGYTRVTFRNDLAGIPRIAAGRRPA